jgi:hypothetical protein
VAGQTVAGQFVAWKVVARQVVACRIVARRLVARRLVVARRQVVACQLVVAYQLVKPHAAVLPRLLWQSRKPPRLATFRALRRSPTSRYTQFPHDQRLCKPAPVSSRNFILIRSSENARELCW